VLVDARNLYETRIGHFEAVSCLHCHSRLHCSQLSTCAPTRRTHTQHRSPLYPPPIPCPSPTSLGYPAPLPPCLPVCAGAGGTAGSRGSLLLRHPRLAGGQPAPPGQPPDPHVLHRRREVGGQTGGTLPTAQLGSTTAGVCRPAGPAQGLCPCLLFLSRL
jgi:hypothetical protein